MCYRTEKCTVCRRVRASFSPEILQAGAVKGLSWGNAGFSIVSCVGLLHRIIYFVIWSACFIRLLVWRFEIYSVFCFVFNVFLCLCASTNKNQVSIDISIINSFLSPAPNLQRPTHLCTSTNKNQVSTDIWSLNRFSLQHQIYKDPSGGLGQKNAWFAGDIHIGDLNTETARAVDDRLFEHVPPGGRTQLFNLVLDAMEQEDYCQFEVGCGWAIIGQSRTTVSLR